MMPDSPGQARVRRRAIGAAVIVFGLVLAVLTARDFHYLPAELVVEGTLELPWAGTLRWDSGDGFNEFEKKPFVVPADVALPLGQHRLEIVRDGARNEASADAEVWIRLIELDDGTTKRVLDLGTVATSGTSVNSGGRICLTSDGSAMQLEERFRAVTVHFDRHPYSGKARVLIDGTLRAVVDLYATADNPGIAVFEFAHAFEPGPFKARLALPRAELRGLRLETADGSVLPAFSRLAIVSEAGEVPLQAPAPDERGFLTLTGFDPKTRVFHPGLLAMHVFVALVLAWVASRIAGASLWDDPRGWRAGLANLFFAPSRRLFWLLLAVATLLFSTWLLSYWPGMMTGDSLDSWRQIKSLHFGNWNPFVYTLYVFALTRLWDSPAIIVLVQVVGTAALGAWVFSFLRGEGLPFRWVAPFFVLFVASVPVGVYTLMVWRDVPFCLLTVFWAALIYVFAVRRHVGRPVELSWRGIAGLSAVLVFSSSVRHNGLLSLFAVPAIFAAARLVPLRRAVGFFAASVALYAVLIWGVGNVIGAHRNTDYRIVGLSLQLNSWAALLDPRAKAWSDDPEGDERVLGAFITRDELQRVYNPLSVTNLVYTSTNRRADITDAEADAIRRLYVRRMAENLHIFLAERAYLFFATLGFRNWGYSSNLQFRLFDPNSESLFYLHEAPKVRWLRELQDKILVESIPYKGLFRGSFLFWNAFLPLVLITGLFLLSRWLPMTALSCGFVLLHALGLFFTVISNDFRYVYFLQLFAYFVVPMALLEVRLRRRKAVGDEPGASAQPAATAQG